MELTSEKIDQLLASFPEERLREIYHFWNGEGPFPNTRPELVCELQRRMSNPQTVQQKTRSLGMKLNHLLESFLSAPGYKRAFAEIFLRRPSSILTSLDLEASLAALERRGLLYHQKLSTQNRCYGIPEEIALGILDQIQRESASLSSLVTLKGFLEETHRNNRTGTHHLRETYRLLVEEESILSRLEHLEPGLKGLVSRAIADFGGFLPRSLFDRLTLDLLSWDGAAWRGLLEQKWLGTVRHFSLQRHGILHDEETLLVFHEVSLAYFRRHGLKKKSPKGVPVTNGVDFLSNLDRFITYVLENPVKFTMQGDIFRTTERRIGETLLQNRCREIQSQDLLNLVHRFCNDHRLIEKTGERVFTLSSAGREWNSQALVEKMRVLVRYACEEKNLGGDFYHQSRLRQLFLRYLSRLDPGRWYDAMALPLLVRNAYLVHLETQPLRDSQNGKHSASSHVALEDLQQMSWNLFAWVRKRLHPMGIVDLAYDRSGRPVSISLSRLGAEVIDSRKRRRRRNPGQLVVNADFEVVLFPTENSYETIHSLDRFCTRVKSDRLYHYRIEEESVRRALGEGMPVSAILGTLEENSRVPLPQNVLFSIKDWSAKIGAFTVEKKNHVHANREEALNRFLADARVRHFLSSRLGPTEAVMKRTLTQREIRRLLVECGFCLLHP